MRKPCGGEAGLELFFPDRYVPGVQAKELQGDGDAAACLPAKGVHGLAGAVPELLDLPCIEPGPFENALEQGFEYHHGVGLARRGMGNEREVYFQPTELWQIGCFQQHSQDNRESGMIRQDSSSWSNCW